MFGYHLQLAIRSLRRNAALTALMVAAVGMGIGASMNVFAVLRALSGDPIPDKSSRLFVPLIDSWGPDARGPGPSGTASLLQDQLSYRDAMALMKAHRGIRQTALYSVSEDVSPLHAKPFSAVGRAAYRDFFRMFEVPFRYGSPWSTADDDDHTNVVVLSDKLSDRLFPRLNPIGRTITLAEREYRIVGVTEHWSPAPRFYDLTSGNGNQGADYYLPFSTAIDRQMDINGNNNCNAASLPGWEGHLNSECVWLQFWVELPSARAARDYLAFLNNYAADQRTAGRFHWSPRVELHDVHDWMVIKKVVPDEIRVSTLIAFGFLVVCLINAIGLMLAKFSGRAGELALRRALGATRGDIFRQCLIETGLVGALGGLLGLGLTLAGIAAQRALGAHDIAHLVSLDGGLVVITLTLAVAATVCSGLYPTWRASRVQPAWQLKAQ